MSEPIFSIQFKRPESAKGIPLYAILPMSSGYAEICVPQDLESFDALIECLEALKPVIVKKKPVEDFDI